MEQNCENCKPATLCEELKEDIKNNRQDIRDIFGRLTSVENEAATFKNEVKNLCKQIENLVNTLRWSVGIILTVGGLLVAIFKH